MAKNLSEAVGQAMVKLIESGTNPFNVVYNPNPKRDLTTEDAKILAINYKTNKGYEGINRFLLGSGYFLTFNQIKEMKGKLKPNSKGKGKPIFFHTYQTSKTLTEWDKEQVAKAEAQGKNSFTTYNNDYKKLEDGTWIKSYYCDKSFYVFNIEDCEGLPELHLPKDVISDEDNVDLKEVLEIFTSKTGFKIVEGSKEFIDYNNKTITILHKDGFEDMGDYYAMLFRNIATSTRNALNRKVHQVKDETYCQEQLTSEIASYLICGSAKVLTAQSKSNSASTLKKWSDTIQEAKLINRIWTSVLDAIKIFDFLTKN